VRVEVDMERRRVLRGMLLHFHQNSPPFNVGSVSPMRLDASDSMAQAWSGRMLPPQEEREVRRKEALVRGEARGSRAGPSP
jgi:hypothetical protein